MTYTWSISRRIWIGYAPEGYSIFDSPGLTLRRTGRQYSVGGDIRQNYRQATAWTLWL